MLDLKNSCSIVRESLPAVKIPVCGFLFSQFLQVCQFFFVRKLWFFHSPGLFKKNKVQKSSFYPGFGETRLMCNTFYLWKIYRKLRDNLESHVWKNFLLFYEITPALWIIMAMQALSSPRYSQRTYLWRKMEHPGSFVVVKQIVENKNAF